MFEHIFFLVCFFTVRFCVISCSLAATAAFSVHILAISIQQVDKTKAFFFSLSLDFLSHSYHLISSSSMPRCVRAAFSIIRNIQMEKCNCVLMFLSFSLPLCICGGGVNSVRVCCVLCVFLRALITQMNSYIDIYIYI